MARRRAEPSPRTCAWPTNSSSVRGRTRCASGATSAARSWAASEKRSPIYEQYAPGDGADGGLLPADPARRRAERLRAVSPHGGAALAAEAAGGADPPGRAAVPDGSPVLRALAEALNNRDRARDRAHSRRRDRSRCPAAAPLVALHAVRDGAARHARADVAVGVPDDSPRARARFRVRLARLPGDPARLADPRRRFRRCGAWRRADGRRRP